MALGLVACKESGANIATVDAPEADNISCAPNFNNLIDGNPAGSVTGNIVRDLNNTDLGFWVENVGAYTWAKQSGTSYYYAINTQTGAVQGANIGMIYRDYNCTDLLGEVSNYPLHLGGDSYVFHFEDQWYEYPIAGPAYYGPWPITGSGYYFRTERGACRYCAGTLTNVREVTPSAVSGINETYPGPITH